MCARCTNLYISTRTERSKTFMSSPSRAYNSKWNWPPFNCPFLLHLTHFSVTKFLIKISSQPLSASVSLRISVRTKITSCLPTTRYLEGVFFWNFQLLQSVISMMCSNPLTQWRVPLDVMLILNSDKSVCNKSNVYRPTSCSRYAAITSFRMSCSCFSFKESSSCRTSSRGWTETETTRSRLRKRETCCETSGSRTARSRRWWSTTTPTMTASYSTTSSSTSGTTAVGNCRRKTHSSNQTYGRQLRESEHFLYFTSLLIAGIFTRLNSDLLSDKNLERIQTRQQHAVC